MICLRLVRMGSPHSMLNQLGYLMSMPTEQQESQSIRLQSTPDNPFRQGAAKRRLSSAPRGLNTQPQLHIYHPLTTYMLHKRSLSSKSRPKIC